MGAFLLLGFLSSLLATANVAASASAPADSTRPSANAEFLAKNYPPESLQRGEQGRVGFQLTFEADGSLTGCAITHSSGVPTLDNGTCDMLALSARIEPARDAEGRRVRTVRTGYVDWKLPPNGVRMAQASAAGGKSSADPLICKRTSVPGSIIKKIKRCMTKSEWAIQDRIVREEVRRAMDGNTCSDHGC
jgi:TonB family protein